MTAPSPIRSDRAARAFVGAVSLLMVAQCAWIWFCYARNIPLTEDWILVSGLTGHDPHFWRTLWAQNNEHRVPFPQLVLQGVLRLGGGDFRAGMVFDIALLAVTAAGLIKLARSIRGRASYADAFFPIAFLHLGNWENLFWSWQATQVIPTVLVVAVIYLLVRAPDLATVLSASLAGLDLILMPLCGANGLFLAPFFGGWFCYCAWRQRRAGLRGRRLAPAVILVGATGIAGVIAVLYFVGYVPPKWVPENPGVVASLAAGLHFLSLAFGPVARSSWILAGIGLVAAVGWAIWVTVRRLGDLGSDERHRALGLLSFTGIFILFGFVAGWGRAGAIMVYGTWPLRYPMMALPVLIVAFFLATLYSPPRRREWLSGAMMAAMVALLPFNTVHGFWSSVYYVRGTTRVLADLEAGADAATMVERDGKFLHHSRDPVDLANEMVMLKAARVGPWVALREDPNVVWPEGPARDGLVAKEIRYRRPGDAKAELVWGVDGWRPLAPAQWPAGTQIRKGVMTTPMRRIGEYFVANFRAPKTHPLQYGFLVTEPSGQAKWDGDYDAAPGGAGVINVAAKVANPPPARSATTDTAALVPVTVRYRTTLASAGFLVWGVNGWYRVPEGVRVGRTVIEKDKMKTTLIREGDDLVAVIDAPAGARLDYGVTLTARRGLFDFVSLVWDGTDDHPRIEAGIPIQAQSSVSLPDAVGEVVGAWRTVLAVLMACLVLWAVGFVSLGLTARRPERTAG